MAADFTLPPINQSFTAGMFADRGRDVSPPNRMAVNDFGNKSPRKQSPMQRRKLARTQACII